MSQNDNKIERKVSTDSEGFKKSWMERFGIEHLKLRRRLSFCASLVTTEGIEKALKALFEGYYFEPELTQYHHHEVRNNEESEAMADKLDLYQLISIPCEGLNLEDIPELYIEHWPTDNPLEYRDLFDAILGKSAQYSNPFFGLHFNNGQQDRIAFVIIDRANPLGEDEGRDKAVRVLKEMKEREEKA